MAESGPGSMRDGMRWGLLLAAVAVSGYRPQAGVTFRIVFRQWREALPVDPSAADLYRTIFMHQRRGNRHYFGRRRCGNVLPPAGRANVSGAAAMMYQLGWSTLPGLRGLSCSEFRAAVPTAAPDNERGVAVEFASESRARQLFAATRRAFCSPTVHQRRRCFRYREGIRAAART